MKIVIVKEDNWYDREVREVEPEDILKLTDEFDCEITINRLGQEEWRYDLDGPTCLGFCEYEVTLHEPNCIIKKENIY